MKIVTEPFKNIPKRHNLTYGHIAMNEGIYQPTHDSNTFFITLCNGDGNYVTLWYNSNLSELEPISKSSWEYNEFIEISNVDVVFSLRAKDGE